MKINDFRPITQQLELTSPKDGSNLGIFLDVVGPDSVQVRTTERRLHKESIANGKSGVDMEVEEIEQILIKKYAAAVVGWDEKYNDDMGGAYSEKFVLDMFCDPDFRWIVDQVADFVSQRKNFFR